MTQHPDWLPPATAPCGKLGFLTRTAAKQAARRFARKKGQRFRAYRCPHPACTALPWHLATRKPPRGNQP